MKFKLKVLGCNAGEGFELGGDLDITEVSAESPSVAHLGREVVRAVFGHTSTTPALAWSDVQDLSVMPIGSEWVVGFTDEQSGASFVVLATERS
jgi:hypothetical protein